MDQQGNEHVEALDLEPTAPVRTRPPRALWGALAVVAVAVGAVVVTSTDDNGNQRPGLPVDLAGAARGAGGAEAAADASMLAWVTYVPGDDLPALGGEATAYRLSGDVDEGRVRELADALGLDGDVESDGAQSWSVDGGDAGRLDVYSGAGASWSFYAAAGDCVVDADGFTSCGNAIVCAEGPGVQAQCEASSSGAGASPGVGLCEAQGLDCVDPTTSTTYCADGDALCQEACIYPPDAECPSNTGECVDSTGEVIRCGGAGDAGGDTGANCTNDDCIARCEETGECPTAPECAEAGPCPDVAPAADLPNEDDARAAALEIVAAGGADVDGARVTAEPGFNAWFITVEPEVDGLPTGLFSYVEVGEDLRIISGNGYLGQPEALGEYPLLDTRAAIERANAQSESYSGIEPALGAPDAMSGTSGGTDTGGTDDVATDPGTAADPCAVPEGASDGCGGESPSTTANPCKVQPDGSEICEFCETGTAIGGADGVTTTIVGEACPPAGPCDPARYPECAGIECPQLAPDVAVPAEDEASAADPDAPVASDDEPVAAPDRCAPPLVDPVPEPEPLEIVLTDAEHSLMLLPANDGSGDAYLIPAYRFTAKDSGTVDLPAVADEALTGPATPETTVPDTVVPDPDPVPEPQPCEVLEEQDPQSETTLTVQTCNPDEDALVIGEPYYVDIDVECAGGSFELGGKVWITEDEEVAGWADPGERHEGGTFTLDSEDHGTFVGDAGGTLTAEFRTLGSNGSVEDIFCTPQPR